jgi:hypothetical protein
MKTFLSTSYFPNIQYFSKLINSTNVCIEVHENFQKQTFRNRCIILTANGLSNLTVPVLEGRSGKIKTKDIKISYQENWQHQHKISIMSAYGSAPFYEFFIDYFFPFFEKKYNYLLDLNNKILETCFKLTKLEIKIELTDDFVNNLENDYRFSISPKIKTTDLEFNPKPYIQVFNDRFDFQTNLSIIDLLFNLGSETKQYLKNCKV